MDTETGAERHDTSTQRRGHQAVDHRNPDRNDDRSAATSDGYHGGKDHRETVRSETAPPSEATSDIVGQDRSATDRTGGTRHDGLLSTEHRHEYRDRWDHLQARFVDDPRGSTEEADRLLEEAFEDLTSRWRERRGELKSGWSDSDASTEELRTSLRRYRDAFERLLSF